MNLGDLASEKKALRAAALDRRRAAALALAPRAAGAAVLAGLLEAVAVPPGATISGYWPMGDELDPRPLLEHFHAAGHPVGLPVVVRRGEPLLFRRWRPGDRLVPAPFGLQVPPPEAPALLPSVLLTPLLAFDRAGYRLGYGGGFYDRTLALLRGQGRPLAIGLAYAAQEVESLPRAGYDEPLDWIVTEREAFRIASRRGEAGGR